MDNNTTYKIGAYNIVAILVTFIGTTAVLFAPFSASQVAQQDAWMAPLIALPLGIYVIYMSCWLGSIFPNQGFLEYLPLILGKYAGKLIGLLYILFFIWFTVTVEYEALALFYGIGLFRTTPILAMTILGLVSTTYAVFSGIESISRSIWYLWTITVVFSASTVFLTVPMVKLSALRPIGESGINAILQSGLMSSAFSGELLLLLIIFPFVRSRRDALMGGIISIVLLSVFISLSVVLCISIMGVESTARNYYSIFALADYLETTGIKIMLASTWIMVFWGKITLAQFAITTGISQLCGLKRSYALTIPVAIMLLILCPAFYPNVTDLFSHVGDAFPGVALVMEYLFPTLLLLVAVVKKRMGLLGEQPQQIEQSPANSARY